MVRTFDINRAAYRSRFCSSPGSIFGRSWVDRALIMAERMAIGWEFVGNASKCLFIDS